MEELRVLVMREATVTNLVTTSVLICSENPDEGLWLNSSPTVTGASVSIVEK